MNNLTISIFGDKIFLEIISDILWKIAVYFRKSDILYTRFTEAVNCVVLF